jgi:hypothetical protein
MKQLVHLIAACSALVFLIAPAQVSRAWADKDDICSPQMEQTPQCTSGEKGTWAILLGSGKIDTGYGGFRSAAHASGMIARYQRWIACVCAHGDWSMKCFSPPDCKDGADWNPARPVCVACGASGASLGRTFLRDASHGMVDEWKDQLRSALEGYTLNRLLKTSNNPFEGIGDQVSAYGQQLVEAHERVRRLEDLLTKANTQMTDQISSELDALERELYQSADAISQFRGSLPPIARQSFEEAEREAARKPGSRPLEELVKDAQAVIQRADAAGVKAIPAAGGLCDGYELLPGEKCCQANDEPDFFMVCARGAQCPPLPNMTCR